MSEKNIWSQLRGFGLTEHGTAAVMGNLYCESLLKSNNVEDRCHYSDDEYTARVDSGEMIRAVFVTDAYGYGIAQWTYPPRKAALYDFAQANGASIADEDMQIAFLMEELKSSYAPLLNDLKATDDIYAATDRFCKEFERPAVNNVAARYAAAQRIYEANTGTAPQVVQNNVDLPNRSMARCDMPELKRGDKGIAVGMVQFALQKHGYRITADCDFGNLTHNAVNDFKQSRKVNNTGDNFGRVTAEVWEKLYL